MEISPSNRYVAIGLENGDVKVYSAYNYVLLSSYPTGNTVNVVRFSEDGKYLAIGTISSVIITILNGYYPFNLNITVPTSVGSDVIGIDFSKSSTQMVVCG